MTEINTESKKNISDLSTNTELEWHLDGFRLCHFTLRILAINVCNVQIFNTSKYHAMLYNAIEDIDPKFAKMLHTQHRPSLWNFSTFICDKFTRPESGLKGDYTIPEKSELEWHITTIYPDIAERIYKLKELHLGQLNLAVFDCKAIDETCKLPPDHFSAITIQIHTPLVLFDSLTKKYLPFTEENLIKWQFAKLRKIGLITNGKFEDFMDYIRFLQSPRVKKGQTVTIDSKPCRIEGLTGYLTIKIMGDELMREHLYNLFQISQFAGLGSNCNLGFGQNNIINIR